MYYQLLTAVQLRSLRIKNSPQLTNFFEIFTHNIVFSKSSACSPTIKINVYLTCLCSSCSCSSCRGPCFSQNPAEKEKPSRPSEKSVTDHTDQGQSTRVSFFQLLSTSKIHILPWLEKQFKNSSAELCMDTVVLIPPACWSE